MIVSGLASESRRGGAIDRFRGRLIWPIRDITGEVIGFGARKLREDDQGPKYLNTPETPLYKKSQVLYGIDLAKKEIAQDRPRGRRRGLHRRHGLPSGRRDHRDRHLRHLLRRRPHQDPAPAADGQLALGGGVHLRRRRRRAEGRAARLRGRPEVRRRVRRSRSPRTAWTPANCAWPRATRPSSRSVEGRTPLFEFAHPVGRRAARPASPEGQVGRAGGDRPDRGPDQGRGDPAQVRRACSSGLLGHVTDTQFVVRRVSQLARWEHGGSRAATRGATGPPGPTGTGRRTAPGTVPRRAAARPAAPGWTCAARPTAWSANCSSSPCSIPELVSPAFDAYGEDEFTGPPYAAVRRAIARGRRHRARRRRLPGPGPGGRARRHGADAMVTELAVEPVMHKVPEIYAGEVLVRVRLQRRRPPRRPGARRAAPGWPPRACPPTPRRRPRSRTSCGPSSSTASGCGCRARRRCERLRGSGARGPCDGPGAGGTCGVRGAGLCVTGRTRVVTCCEKRRTTLVAGPCRGPHWVTEPEPSRARRALIGGGRLRADPARGPRSRSRPNSRLFRAWPRWWHGVRWRDRT